LRAEKVFTRIKRLLWNDRTLVRWQLQAVISPAFRQLFDDAAKGNRMASSEFRGKEKPAMHQLGRIHPRLRDIPGQSWAEVP
jgi:hypothetical protein